MINILFKSVASAYFSMKEKRFWPIHLRMFLEHFYGENENAIRTQVWCTLIAQLLLTVLQKKAKVKKAFSTVATLIRIHLVSLLDVIELIQNTKRSWKIQKQKVSATTLFDT